MPLPIDLAVSLCKLDSVLAHPLPIAAMQITTNFQPTNIAVFMLNPP